MIGSPCIRFDTVTSTQDVAFRLAELGAPEGLTVVAGYQSDGRGRAGRVWETAPGDALLFSLLLRPPFTGDPLAPLSILVADAIADSLATLYGLSPAIKWPNDVLLDGGKASGVLIQVRGGVTVVGIGINLLTSPPGAASIRAALGADPDVDALHSCVVSSLDRRYRALLNGDIAGYISAANERLWLRGHDAVVQDAGREVAGLIHAVRDDGALLLDTPEGIRAIVSGELTRGPRPAPR